MLIEANIVLFKCILNSDNRRSSPGVDSRAMSWPTWRRAPETDWATEHVVQRFRKKYFLRRKIFLAEKNILLAEKNISCGKKYFLRKIIFSTMLPISFRMFPPVPFDFIIPTECCVFRFKSVPTWWLCRPIGACAARLSPARIFVLLSSSLLMPSGEIYLDWSRI